MAQDSAQAHGHPVREILEQLCAHNRAGEIHYEQDGALRTARMRFITLGADELQIDRPQCIGRDVNLPDGTELTAYFYHEGELHAFSTRVLRQIVIVDLNRQKRVVGMALALPAAIRREQRRRDFRVSLARHDVPVTLHELDADTLASAPRSAARFPGRAVNLSAGGLGVMVEKAACPKLEVWQRLYVLFTLPEDDEPLALPAEIRQVRAVHDGLELMLGLRFLDTGEVSFRTQTRRIGDFIIAEQRRQIRRRRGGGAST